MPDLIAALDREGVFLVLGGPADEKGSVFLALQQLHGPVPVNVRHQPGLLLTVGHLPAGLDQQPGSNKNSSWDTGWLYVYSCKKAESLSCLTTGGQKI